MGFTVLLNVYDVTNTANENTNSFIQRLNSITRELSIGGVFHGAIEVDDVEWSFGYCESGTGVYCCRARQNTMYNFRETLELGVTEKSKQEIKEIVARLKRAWAGTSYDLLQRNCCHFCEQLCAELGVPPPPAWLNRFAQGADATIKLTNEASALAKRVGANLTQTATVSANWLREMSARVMAQMTQHEEDAVDDSPRLYETFGSSSSSAIGLSMQSMPPPAPSGSSVVGPGGNDSGVDLSTQSEPVGLGGRIAGRLRALAPSGTGTGDAGSNGLPASTAAAAGPGGFEGGGRSFAASASSGSSSGLAALKQKWQELEASAGDGTKQFLFGLIKTRQTRFDEDDPGFPAPGSSAASSQADLSSRGLPNAAPASTSGAPSTVPTAASVQDGARAGAAVQGVALPPPTQPPLQQVISHTLLPGDVVGASNTHAPAASTAVTGARPAAVAPAPSSGHLLDM
ncbi:hypothetical protein CHLRE_02g074600v5 [Chlamydomonas reinhardtii]|uniref:Uncharacterized protein n=1 Tax=Chlamydomonas reinhardtii TaxID=3055 RepID=A8I9X2_CHLRE|nr:uncharacterized protein CHLRE_02g074600v5 [Chlamydomonas reinhardtii]PNW86134.1 hypothetical protein CHLRE_02g074600v5 [Chlamydomonas reinhardtii]|eukprot:XP_001701830.1 predicted protein [Chlamydomonas reinhardtii]